MLFEEIKLPVQKRSKARLELVINRTIQILESEGLGKCTIPEIAKVEPYRVCRRPTFLRECPDEKSKIHP